MLVGSWFDPPCGAAIACVRMQVAKQLQQKAWLMHWSLFVFFNHENGLNALIDLFMQDR